MKFHLGEKTRDFVKGQDCVVVEFDDQGPRTVKVSNGSESWWVDPGELIKYV